MIFQERLQAAFFPNSLDGCADTRGPHSHAEEAAKH